MTRDSREIDSHSPLLQPKDHNYASFVGTATDVLFSPGEAPWQDLGPSGAMAAMAMKAEP